MFNLTCLCKQDVKIEDSDKLKNTRDKVDIINNLNRKSFKYINSNPDSARFFSDSAIKLSKLIHNDSLLAVSMINYAFSYLAKKDSVYQLRYIQNAINIFKVKKDRKGEASIFTKIGDNYHKINNYNKSLFYYYSALNIFKELKENKRVSNLLYSKIGELYIINSNYSEAMKVLFQALKISEQNNDSSCVADALTNIGYIYIIQNNITRAKNYFDRAININKKLGRNIQITKCLINLGVYYQNIDSNYYALNYYNEALNIYNKSGENVPYELYLNIGQIYQFKSNYVMAESYFIQGNEIVEEENNNEGKYWAYRYIGDFYIETGNIKKAEHYFMLCKSKANELKNLSFIGYVYKSLAVISEKQNNFKAAYKYNVLYNKIKDSMLNREKIDNINKIETQYEQDKKDAVTMQEKKTLNIIMISFIIGSALLLLLAFYIYLNYRNKKKANRLLAEKNIIISYEQEKSENLLLNTLPASIAKRLKDGEQTIVDHFDEASVVFIDQVDFTSNSSVNTPETVVQILNSIYTEFDKIAVKFNLEKIKTIGDCYMAASGVPIPNEKHAEAAADFAFEVLDKMKNHTSTDGKVIRFRVGIDCGPVVAGIIGENKFIYDLWGDTVNTASRMEQYGAPGKIQVTERFKETLTGSQYQFEKRGEIEIKGKGKMITWFLQKYS